MSIKGDAVGAAQAREAMGRASASLAQRWNIPLPKVDGASSEILPYLDALARSLRGAEESDGTELSPAALVLRRRLLDQLRGEVVRGWAASVAERDAGEMLDLLLAFEAAREQLDAVQGDSFAARLLGPDGLALIMELAHDLRSPLASILFLSDALRRGQSGETNEVQRHQLGIIYKAALGLLCTVSDVLELTQGGDRLSDSQPSPFSVREVMESVRDMVLPIAEEKQLAIEIVAPEGTNDHRMGFPVALSRVLLNLTSNALKYTDKGMVELAAVAGEGESIVFSVRDTGDGIAPEVVRDLYEPFRRNPGRKDVHFSGTGLGLSICRTLVSAMGAELKIETRPGWGTRFHFELNLPPVHPL